MSLQEELGKIQINDSVIARIASVAAVEVEGIASAVGGASWTDYLGGKSQSKSPKGIKVNTDEAGNYVVIDMEVNVQYGFEIYKAVRQLQRAVKNAVEAMTGLQVKAVNVKICEIVDAKGEAKANGGETGAARSDRSS